MSMYTYIELGKPVDKKYEEYRKVWEACETAGIDIPTEVLEYFDYETPDGKGIWNQVHENTDGSFDCEAVEYEGRDGTDSWLVDISKLPKDIKLIKFTNSY